MLKVSREFKLRVIRQMTSGRQRKILRCQAIKSKLTCCFKTEIHNYSFDRRKKKFETQMFNENFAMKCSNEPAVCRSRKREA
jgi:hypothetical protein